MSKIYFISVKACVLLGISAALLLFQHYNNLSSSCLCAYDIKQSNHDTKQ